MSTAGNGDTITLKSGSTAAIKITNAANGLVFSDSTGNNQLIAPIAAGIWYRMKIEANTDADTFDIYLSTPSDTNLDDNMVRGGGRMDLLSNVIPFFDSLEFATSVSGSGQLWLDNIKVNGPLYRLRPISAGLRKTAPSLRPRVVMRVPFFFIDSLYRPWQRLRRCLESVRHDNGHAVFFRAGVDSFGETKSKSAN